jgi:hypothetical protein
MILRCRISRVLSLAVLLAPLTWAQDAFLVRWETLRAVQPAGVELRIAAPKAAFYFGETIPLTLSFTATNLRSFVADSRLQDRVGRMNYIEEFVPDSATAEDPLRGLPGETGGMGGLSGENAILSSDKPFTVERILNEWVRFRAPGRYRLYVLSRRVRQVTGTGQTDQELQMFAASKPVEVVSNVVTLEIAAAPPEWLSEHITAATAIFDNTTGNDSESGRAQQRAGLTLRFLNTVESGTALAKRLPGVNSVDAFSLHSGILDSSHRTELLPVMEQLLAEPGQAISERFLTTLAQLAVLVESGGIMLPYPSDEAARQAWQKESQRRAALVVEKRDHYVSVLVQKLRDKQAESRALTRDALLSVAEAAPIRPPWLTGIVDSLIADFRTLPGQMQSSLLDSRRHLVRNRDVLPLLNDLYVNPPQPPLGYPSISELVLRRIYELAPDRGRPLVLAELHRPDGPLIGEKTLMMLPDENLPELNDVFSAQAARGGPLPTLLITRYGTSEIVKNVEAGYLAFNAELDRQKLPHCPFPLVFYFLKFDPEFGERELRKAFATGPCYDIGRAFDSLGSYAMSQALERIAIEHLTSTLFRSRGAPRRCWASAVHQRRSSRYGRRWNTSIRGGKIAKTTCGSRLGRRVFSSNVRCEPRWHRVAAGCWARPNYIGCWCFAALKNAGPVFRNGFRAPRRRSPWRFCRIPVRSGSKWLNTWLRASASSRPSCHSSRLGRRSAWQRHGPKRRIWSGPASRPQSVPQATKSCRSIVNGSF